MISEGLGVTNMGTETLLLLALADTRCSLLLLLALETETLLLPALAELDMI